MARPTLTPTFLRHHLILLGNTRHKSSERRTLYRAVRAHLNKYESDVEPGNGQNPIVKVSMPRLQQVAPGLVKNRVFEVYDVKKA